MNTKENTRVSVSFDFTEISRENYVCSLDPLGPFIVYRFFRICLHVQYSLEYFKMWNHVLTPASLPTIRNDRSVWRNRSSEERSENERTYLAIIIYACRWFCFSLCNCAMSGTKKDCATSRIGERILLANQDEIPASTQLAPDADSPLIVNHIPTT